jgi:hypothetical protein
MKRLVILLILLRPIWEGGKPVCSVGESCLGLFVRTVRPARDRCFPRSLRTSSGRCLSMVDRQILAVFSLLMGVPGIELVLIVGRT